MRIRTSLLPLVLFLALAVSLSAATFTGPWDVAALQKTPSAEWGARTGLVQEVFYASEPLAGKPTRIFAYVGRPAEGTGPFPAMVLVHGGGGEAFRNWAEHWAKRGYVSIAMDTSGRGAKKVRLPDGGPEQDDDTKFLPFADDGAREMWTYHAVAAVLRGHSLLASLPEVDRARIGVTGISWGGYLTCIVAGLDDRVKVAVPVYGCGFLGDNSYWKAPRFDRMPAEQRDRWLKNFDPSAYLGGVRAPILFLNGTSDFAYPLDSYRKSAQLVRPDLRTVAIQVNLKHGHYWNFGEVDAFVDSVLRGGPALPKLAEIKTDQGTASVPVRAATQIVKAELHYTTNSGPWQPRAWQTTPATLGEGVVTAPLPAARPLAFYFSVVDARGLRTSSLHEELPAEK